VCTQKEQKIETPVFIPEKAFKIEYEGGAILYEFEPKDSIKFKLIVDSGVSSFLLDSAYICNNENLEMKIIHYPNVTILASSPFKNGDIVMYKVKHDMSGIFSDKRMNTWAYNFDNKLDSGKNIRGLMPLKAFVKAGVRINLRDKYILPLDSICESVKFEYMKIPITFHYDVPYALLNIMFKKNDDVCSIEGKFTIDYGYIGSIGIGAKTSNSNPFICTSTDSTIFQHRHDTFNIQFNGVSMENIPLCKEPLIDDLAGIIGVRFLAKFDVILDYKEKFLFLKLNDEK
jgi:hypothetical protein